MAATSRISRPKGNGAARHQPRDALILNGAALLATTLVVAAVARLFAFGDWVQLGLVAGACAGLLATLPTWAGIIGVAAVALGLSVTLGFFGPEVTLPAALALVVAAAVRWAVGRKPRAENWVAYAVMGLIVLNMWATTLYVNLPHAGGGTPVGEQVAQSPQLGVAWTDADFYRRVLWDMRGGTGYYKSFRQAFNENAKWGIDPFSVVSYRLPTAFWVWALLQQGAPIALIIAWLLLSTAAFVAGMWLASRRVPPAFALPSAAVLAAYLTYFGTSTIVLFTEAWAATLGVIAVAAAVESYRSKAWRGWTIVAVVIAILACLVRELMVFLPVAGVIAAIVTGGSERRFRVLAWMAGLGVFAAAYAAHAVAIHGAVSGKQATLQALTSGGVQFFVKAFTWGTALIGGGAAVLGLLAIMAVIGIWIAPNPGERWFLALVAALPLSAFLVFGNDARFENGASTNYWGTLIVPILIVLAPWACALVPERAGTERDAIRAKRQR